jgi:NAD(P)-dependent dehydrogenase (short-subunit alcohol dehydrogenase family)
VIITGGAKGIGAASTRASIRDQFFAELQRVRGRGRRVITDLQPTESCAKVVEQTIRTFGRIDALINNANDDVGLAFGSPDKFVDSDTG